MIPTDFTRRILALGSRHSDAEDAIWVLVCAIVAAARRFDTTPQAMAALALTRLPEREEWQQEVARLVDDAEQDFLRFAPTHHFDFNPN